MNAPVSTLTRGAIYTRKSTEYHLELAFNSLGQKKRDCRKDGEFPFPGVASAGRAG